MATRRKSPEMQHTASARRYRERMRSQGLRQVSLWLYDRSSPAFQRECRRQSLLASRAGGGVEIDKLLDQSLEEIEGWTA
jgi:hypothetical protein